MKGESTRGHSDTNRRNQGREVENKRRVEMQRRIRFTVGYMLAVLIVVWLWVSSPGISPS